MQPFMPRYGSNQIVTAGATSAAIAIGRGARTIRIVNTGSGMAYLRTFNSADAAQTAAKGQASSADFPLPAGVASTLSVGSDHDQLAHFSPAGTTLQVMQGEGF